MNYTDDNRSMEATSTKNDVSASGGADVMEGDEVPAAFHPRYSASGKLYSYRILNRPAGSPFITRYAWHVPTPVLEVERMQAAAELVKGRHDFAAFQSAGSETQSTVRRIFRCNCITP